MSTTTAFLAQFYMREWMNQTYLHPLAAITLLALGALTLALPRENAILPVVLLASLVPASQRVAVAGLDFNLLRIMVIFGAIRIFTRGEWKDFKWGLMDTLMILWGVSGALAYILLFLDVDAIEFQAGRRFEAWGLYFMVRCFVRDWDDVLWLSRALAIICIPLSLVFFMEYTTGRNAFAIFGGVPEITIRREGRMRCQGAFSHPILAGCFFASMMPLAGAAIWNKRAVLFGAFGVIGCLVAIVTTSSSTSWGAGMAAIFAFGLFPFRRNFKQLRYAVAAGAVALHFGMEKPLWHLLARIDLVGGSTGYHRYTLIDQFVNNWRSWFLLGIEDTSHWGYFLFDLANQYVFEGVQGGFGGLFFFLALLVTGFRFAGRLMEHAEGDAERMALAYGLGMCFFVHMVNFIGVSYFGQMQFSWYLVLALAASLAEAVDRAQASGEPEAAVEEHAGEEELPFGARPRRPLPRRRRIAAREATGVGAT